MKKMLSANEAVACGAANAGCVVASAYPGTPSTEILENIAKFKDTVKCEWAVNEKVAMETAIGASIAGARSLTAMKHVGLNVAMDPLMTFTYVGATGGMVVCVADDPGMHSSQNEQDNRNLAKFARAPMLEPSDSQEAYDMVQAAFEMSEKYEVPCFLRLTTRTSHSSSLVDLGDFRPAPHPLIPYRKDIAKTIPVPMFARGHRIKAQKRTEAMSKAASASAFNRIEKGLTSLGIVTSGVSYQYVKEVFPEFSVLKLGWTNPLPRDLIEEFAKGVDRLLVVEELDPFLEEQIRAMGIKVVEHETEMNMLELNPDRVRALRHEILGDVPAPRQPVPPKEALPTRPPVLCAGCGHRGVFYVLNKLKATVTGDIGCYTLGAFPPLNAMDTTICMGASIGNAAGMKKAGYKGRVCAILGDSTFFHSGITGILSAQYNGTPVTTVVLDNRITGMTGHQDNPGSGKTLTGEPAPVTEITEIAKACGLKKVVTVSADDLAGLERVLADAMDGEEGALIVAYAPCRIAAKLTKEGLCEVEADKCKSCGACFKLGCPAITRGDESAPGRFKMKIDASLCAGCKQCTQVCRFGAIKRVR
ncbi:MAG: indolepyruvate ferredoxin oxidoreductase subunit alpha [Verrucomicrobiota bacterium]|nr:indolepyruvate ferredoxin oxidoreductase subunit alpha [Verrucomicrobiota bacterium]MDY5597491.1 indolepyruvate ferredoxin oxidoreductase subunit alpha [Kiritimatiellia bacterium]